MKKTDNQKFYEWLNDIGDFIPILQNTLYILIGGRSSVLNFRFFTSLDGYEPGAWEENKKTISLNSRMPIHAMVEDLINMISDVNNDNHKLYSYEKFLDGKSYADCKIKVQYQSFWKSNQIILSYVNEYYHEAKKLFKSENDYEHWCQEIEENTKLSYEKFREERKEIFEFFSSDWSNWNNWQNSNQLNLIGEVFLISKDDLIQP